MKPDVIVIGTGPGGIASATTLAQAGVNVRIVDEQPCAGGQVYRASEKIAASRTSLREWLGPDYTQGLDLIQAARREGNIDWCFDTSVWDISCREDGIQLGLLKDEKASIIDAPHVVLATGAMERPSPFSGWTLPGVMSIGAAQTLFKDAGLIPDDDVVLAGSGPLLYLFANQLLNAGTRPGLIVDTAPKWVSARHLLQLASAARHNLPALYKGLAWRQRISRAGIPHVFGVCELRACGTGRVESVKYRNGGRIQEVPASLLLIHDGVIPNTHLSVAANCHHVWQARQCYWQPQLDAHGQTSQPGLWAVGDGAGILGAEAATLKGRILARHLAAKLGFISPNEGQETRQNDQRALMKLIPLRGFLDQQFPPAAAFREPGNDTVICRCEAIKAQEIRQIAKLGCVGPNQARSFTRAGMGPCMGRQCGNNVSQLLADELGKSVQDVGYYSTRPPIKPITLGQLASLAD